MELNIDVGHIVAVVIPILLAWWLNRRSANSSTIKTDSDAMKNLSDLVDDLSKQVREVRAENTMLSSRIDEYVKALAFEIQMRKNLETQLSDKNEQLSKMEIDIKKIKDKHEKERKAWVQTVNGLNAELQRLSSEMKESHNGNGHSKEKNEDQDPSLH